ncbi:MAG: rubredoxin [Clostridia bacterium]|nr:rubredoxin [Clostridia bacterium]
MTPFKCTACGYEYKPEEGDPAHNVAKNTPFADLPDDWTCPLCGVGKDKFEPMTMSPARVEEHVDKLLESESW